MANATNPTAANVTLDLELESVLTLSNSDNPGIKLVSNLLTGPNYLSWTRSMIIALRAKDNLGFITVDSMIISWILNSISRDLSDGFLQGSMTLAAYYNKLKRCWDELSVLCPLPPCACGAAKALTTFEERERLIQFLMGLNHQYEHVSNQILLLDPLPSASKAYGMVQNVEKQKKIQITFPESSNITTVMAAQRFNNSRRQSSGDSKFNSNNKADSNFECMDKGTWIVDSGATDHMSGDLALFDSISKLKTPRHIRLPDGRTKLITHTGTIQLSPRITLFNTLYITDFHCNLLSVNYLAFTCKIFVTQYPDHCVLQDLQSKEEIAIGLVVGRLYHINKQSFSITKVNNAYTTHEPHLFQHWHSRLGHPSTNKMRHLSIVPVISSDVLPCTVCPMAKQERLVFPSNVEYSLTIFELIKSVTGAYYIFTIVDDYSRFTWTYMLNSKTQVPSVLTHFLAHIENQFKTHVKAVRTDNGIRHQRTCVYTPQRNGVVERKHKHLLQVARSLMFQSKFPSHFWSETLLTTTHLINRLPSEILKWQNPYELLHGHKPKLDYLRVIGSLCFATNLSPGKIKFSVRGLSSVLLGYDARFHENVFPFHLTNPSSVTDFCLPKCIADDMAIHSFSIPIEPSVNPLVNQIPNANMIAVVEAVKNKPIINQQNNL
ncbi:hypothetical protein MANES_14G152301v8 [Manihot esculenta]|uniref:Uncharacterized protein n=1 Tax=Manihot esculenta TaxID=3983 RepID=A0ACB7GIH0_MANES|nr:hypothetical protein MANES_14G152301v8 [Manihot esculenta]